MNKFSIITFLFSILFVIPDYSLAQIPKDAERKYDEFMEEYLLIYDIVYENDLEEALYKIEKLKPVLLEKAKTIAVDLEGFNNLTPEEEEIWDRKIQNKPYYLKIQDYLSNPDFIKKWQNMEYNTAYVIEDLENEIDSIFSGIEEEDATAYSTAIVFKIYENSQLAGRTLNVISDDENSFAIIDDEGNLNFEIIGTSNEFETNFLFFIEGASEGKYTWASEGNFVIEIFDDSGEQIHGLWGNEEQGFIQIDELNKAGKFVRGSFNGNFMDDIDGSSGYTKISGTFNIPLIDYQY